jgi:TonB family protein
VTNQASDRRRLLSGSRVSFLISLALHAAVILLLGIGGVQKARDEIKLTEISYIEERYGEAVAKQVTVAPEKLAASLPEEPPEALREGSIFAKEDTAPPMPELMAAQMTHLPIPAPKPKPVEAANPFAAAELKSRSRSKPSSAPARVKSEDTLLSAGITDAPRTQRQASEEVDLAGQVLVGRTSRLDEAALFEVSAGDGPSIAGASLTLSVPEGGIAEGRPDLVGGTLAEGKRAYRGDLPAGQLVGDKSSRDRVTALASVQTAGPGGSGILAGNVIEPGRGKGLVSRGGRDAISRGSLGPRGDGKDRPAEPLARAIAPPKPARDNVQDAPAQQTGGDDKGVSMTLSGPILGREVLSSRPPEYPAAARQQGWQGSVSVYFTVSEDGSIKKVFVEKASPYQVLDRAAKRCLEHWRFSPKPGADEQWGVLTIVFRLR